MPKVYQVGVVRGMGRTVQRGVIRVNANNRAEAVKIAKRKGWSRAWVIN